MKKQNCSKKHHIPTRKEVFMKKTYESAKADVIELSFIDILTTSDPGVSSAPPDDDLLDPI